MNDELAIFHAPLVRRAPGMLDLDALRQRVYADKDSGFRAEDFREVKPGIVIVRPIRPPPKTEGGIIVPGTSHEISGQLCWLHQVVAVSDKPPEDCIALVPGDVIICMLAFLDPLDPKGDLCDILHDRIVSKVGHAPLEASPTAA